MTVFVCSHRNTHHSPNRARVGFSWYGNTAVSETVLELPEASEHSQSLGEC